MGNHYGDSKSEQREVFEAGLKASRGRVAPDTVHKLPMAEQFKLMKFVEAEYQKADAHDEEFAATAQEVLGFKVTKHNVSGVRRALGIESTLDRKVREAKERKTVEPQTRLDKMEVRLAALESAFHDLKRQLGA